MILAAPIVQVPAPRFAVPAARHRAARAVGAHVQLQALELGLVEPGSEHQDLLVHAQLGEFAARAFPYATRSQLFAASDLLVLLRRLDTIERGMPQTELDALEDDIAAAVEDRRIPLTFADDPTVRAAARLGGRLRALPDARWRARFGAALSRHLQARRCLRRLERAGRPGASFEAARAAASIVPLLVEFGCMLIAPDDPSLGSSVGTSRLIECARDHFDAIAAAHRTSTPSRFERADTIMDRFERTVVELAAMGTQEEDAIAVIHHLLRGHHDWLARALP